jgi:hypothetical protein
MSWLHLNEIFLRGNIAFHQSQVFEKRVAERCFRAPALILQPVLGLLEFGAAGECFVICQLRRKLLEL